MSTNNTNTDNQHDDSADPNAMVASPFAKRQGHCMKWNGVNMTALAAKAENNKQILTNVSGRAPSGQVTAIMGPSGSGKTSLLNILSGRVSSASPKLTIEADLKLDHHTVDPARDMVVRQRIAFVAQDDSLPVVATPREAILFSARLRLPSTMSLASLEQLTDTMLRELHLQSCADTIVGGSLIKGISGGERKRTSVGVELVTQPAVVFLDEPTSGLDSFNALELVSVLKQVAYAGSAVLLTIHQPSSEIYAALDSLLLLNAGQVMYRGLAADVLDYFEERGHPCPQHHNPADWVLTTALRHSMDQLKTDGFFAYDDVESKNVDSESSDGKSVQSLGVVADKDRVGVITQVELLLRREFQSLKRNKQALKARTGMTLMISILAGIIFNQVAETDFTEFINVQTTFGALLVSLLANVFSTALPSLVAFPEERPVFIREYSTNHYSVTAYFIARFTVELIVTAGQVTVSSMLTYLLVGFSAPYGPFWACLYALALTSTALGVLLGCSVKDAGVAIEFLPLMFMPQILTAGFFAPPDLIPVWLSWVVYIFPLTYATRIVVVAEFDGRCDDLDNSQNGNLCEMVMSNVDAEPDNVWWYWLILVAQFAFFRLLALAILRKKASSFY